MAKFNIANGTDTMTVGLVDVYVGILLSNIHPADDPGSAKIKNKKMFLGDIHTHTLSFMK